jgi:hypothetical protein
MAPGAVLCKRAGLKVLMAAGTLLVKRIRPFGNLLVTLIQIMAFTAGLGIFIFIFRQCMMAIPAGDPITEFRSMGLVIKKDIPGDDLKHHAQRLLRFFFSVSGVTDSAHHQQAGSQHISEF